DAEKSGHRNQTYDVVIATNVIHATGNLEVTLSNVRKLLAPGGIFVLNEITARQDFATLTFGLTDGWWHNNDGYRIADSPLVSSSNWRALLVRAGFAATECHGTEDQQVIVALAASAESLSAVTEPPGLTADEAPLQIKAESDPWRPKTSVPAPPLLDKVQAYICQVISEVMLINAAEIDVNQPFRDYGIDSLIALELLKPFRNDLGALPATILFEHPTVAQLARHFLNEFGAALPRVLGESVSSSSGVAPPPAPTVTGVSSMLVARDFLRGVIAETMMMDVQQIEDEVPFKEYGIDSLISLEILKPLRAAFGSLPATLLFEYPSVAKLSAYFAEHHQQAVRALASSRNGSAPREVIDRPVSVDLPSPRALIRETAARNEDIAIIGLSGQFPQAATVHEFWRNLSEGRDCTSEIPAQRWPLQHFYNLGSPSAGTGSYTKRGGFIRDIDAFDHEFFGITPLEAQRMDPQERLFLQNVYHSILDAGYSKATLQGQEVGVFVGVMNGAYAWHRPRNEEDGSPTSLFWSIANRASYVFDWKGPSLAIDTACSSSLTALHLACQSLHAGDCKTAVVGGVNLIVHPRQYELLCNMHMLSKSECCRPFGENADGFVDGEGICCIVVKPYADALRDNDRIYGIVRGTAINAGGQANGYSAPNPDAQHKLIERAIKRAGIEARNISYVEAHGTGTELGDPIEIRGLSSAFASVPPGSVAIGSVKGNIGHLESAAGLAGVIKVLLQMQARALVPSIHASRENPHLNLSRTPFRIQKTFQPLDVRGPIFASVSSFGAGGANAHVIIQSSGNEAPVRSAQERVAHIAVLSSRTQRGLQRQIDHLRHWLAAHDPEPAALSYTLCCARDHFGCRIGYVFETKEELLRLLQSDLQDFDRARQTTPEEAALTAALNAGGKLNRRHAQLLVDAFVTGHDIPWNHCFKTREIVSLPGYSFEKKRFWVDSEESCFHEPNEIVRQHVILGEEIAPAAWTLSRCLEETGASVFKNVLWSSVIRDVNNVAFHTEGSRFFLQSCDETITYCEGTIAERDSQSNQPEIEHASASALLVEAEEIYRRFNERGYCYGSDMQVLRWAKLWNSQVRGSVDPQHDWGFKVSPGLIEGGLQAAILMPELQNFAREGEILVPYHLGELSLKHFFRSDAIYCHCVLKKASSLERIVILDIHFSNERGEVLLSLRDMVSVVAGIGVLQNRRTALTGRTGVDHTRSPERVAVYEIE
ncbi:MAG TPA: beta-ketoacyl synthase N-terminal-like domain-containing protein, partial [Candidatus Angelobacter sp.]|nr:beta-ketoacyl synthase N-terminal-like domain-containing protein [Candidatus Angelobacter sp.]